MTLKLRNKNVLVLGLGKSGFSVISVLEKQNANIFFYDDNKEKINKLSIYYKNKHTPIYTINRKTIKIIDLVVVSPGIDINCISVKLLKKYNKNVIGEIELFYHFSKHKLVAITGTNGKTTTVSLIKHILDTAKKKSILAGNIGNPLCSTVNEKRAIMIAEISSFQLESIKDFKPKISTLLNITPNHLDRHKTFEKYKRIKLNIIKNQNKSDYVVLNYDDKCFKNLIVKPKKLFFSLHSICRGAFVQDDYFCYKMYRKIHKLSKITETKLIGKHNQQNILCAIIISKLLRIKNKFIISAIQSFSPLAHRLEYIATIQGTHYYNDSKSTSPEATITAIKCFNNVLLLLGGKDKNVNFDKLFIQTKDRVKKYIVYGENKQKIINSAIKNNCKNYEVFNSFVDAIIYSKSISDFGDCVLLSPASSSFDSFANYEERGEYFKSIVLGAKDDEKTI